MQPDTSKKIEWKHTLDDTALVLEGGGMRGIFTIGVLDALMEHGIKFPYVVGVSAGACNGASYVSRQHGRARFSNIDMMREYDYISLRNLITQGNIFDVKLLYDRLPNEIWSYDYPEYFSSDIEYEMVVTNCNTGRAEYKSDRSSRERTMDIILASSTLPYVGRMVAFDGSEYLDGGITDSIPLRHAQEKGYKKAVVVVTRNMGYRKPVTHGAVVSKIQSANRWMYYHKYPRLMEALRHRGEVYNAQLEYLEEQERLGAISVIRPDRPIVVDRIERNVSRLEALYADGHRVAEEWIKEHLNA